MMDFPNAGTGKANLLTVCRALAKKKLSVYKSKLGTYDDLSRSRPLCREEGETGSNLQATVPPR